MNSFENDALKVAILDLYEGVENQGMRCIREILNQFAEMESRDLVKDEFDVRQKNEVPNLDYDIYICSGGPGSPLDSEGSIWENNFFEWIKKIENYNAKEENEIKKQVFFICHSFQLACRYFNVAEVTKRKSTAFGVFPIHYLLDAKEEIIFEGLTDPFYVVDSRDYQVTQPKHNNIKKIGGKLLAIEKARPHVPLERAIMSIRFNENMIGTQFHPEADAIGMSLHLQTEARKKVVIDNYGLEKWQSMIDHLNDPDKIAHTYSKILPNFLADVVRKMDMAGAEI
ncbi:MAG: GMP synthase [Ferruginibacter sp.]|nr:GMP synthase [Ferruginibacter sp.]